MLATFEVRGIRCCVMFVKDVHLAELIQPQGGRSCNVQLLKVVVAGEQVCIGLKVFHVDHVVDHVVEEVEK